MRNQARQTRALLPTWHLLLGQKKTRHLPTATRPKPDLLDNPNRPVSILSNSEPALCALAPVPNYQAAPVPVRSHGFARTCQRPLVAAATPKPARQALRLAVFPGRNHENGEPPPPHAFRHFPLLPAGSPARRLDRLEEGDTARDYICFTPSPPRPSLQRCREPAATLPVGPAIPSSMRATDTARPQPWFALGCYIVTAHDAPALLLGDSQVARPWEFIGLQERARARIVEPQAFPSVKRRANVPAFGRGDCSGFQILPLISRLHGVSCASIQLTTVQPRRLRCDR